MPDNHSVSRHPAQDVTDDLRVPRPVRHEIEALLRVLEDHACQARNKHEHTDNDGPNEKRSDRADRQRHGDGALHQAILETKKNFEDGTFEPDDTVEEVVSDAVRPSLF